MAIWLFLISLILLPFFPIPILIFLIILVNQRSKHKAIGFFHPYTNDGGRGERVLWCAFRAIQQEFPDLDITVYTGDHDATPQSLLGRAIDRFGVKLEFTPKAVELQKSRLGRLNELRTSSWLSQSKVIYYRVFSWMYGFVGSFTHLAMVNSSWTRSHIKKLWRIPDRLKRVYPSCDTSGLQVLPLERSFTPPIFISVSQFRPEKVHSLQLEAFSLAINKLDSNMPRTKLQFVGNCRNKSNEDRLQTLKDGAIELGVEDSMEFHVNVSNKDLVKLLSSAIAGLHSMIDEHFGVVIVEYMAAGAIPLAHNSSRPKMDVVLEENGQQTGFLAQTVEEYVDAILKIIQMPEDERIEVAIAARICATRFSEKIFYEDFKVAIRLLCGVFPDDTIYRLK